jgi:Zn-dependent metalloprotease
MTIIWKQQIANDPHNWLIGENFFHPRLTTAKSLRHLENSGHAYQFACAKTNTIKSDPCLSHYSSKLQDSNNPTDQYCLSTVASKAFEIFTKATKQPSWSVSGPIWFQAIMSLNEKTHANITLQMWSKITIDCCPASEVAHLQP